MDIMIDLETYGLRPGCAIRSVGAVAFDLYRPEAGGDTFSANVTLTSCVDAGLHVDPDTERWWADQSAEAQAHLEIEPRPLREVVIGFGIWWSRQAGKYVWAQGANFDPVLWEVACRAVKLPVPWRYYHVQDTRTVYNLARLDTRQVPRKGTFHCALDDARHQVECLRVAYKKIFCHESK